MAITQVLPYRQTLIPLSNNGATAVFQIPTHPSTSLTIERMVFYAIGGSLTSTDGIVVTVMVAPNLSPSTTLDTGLVLGQWNWIVPSTPGNTVFAFNPDKEPGMNWHPPLRLAPNDNNCYIYYSDQAGGATMGNLKMTVIGWEITSDDLARQYPSPEDVGRLAL